MVTSVLHPVIGGTFNLRKALWVVFCLSAMFYSTQAQVNPALTLDSDGRATLDISSLSLEDCFNSTLYLPAKAEGGSSAMLLSNNSFPSSSTDFIFASNPLFEVNDDGSASITGNLVSASNSSDKWKITIYLSNGMDWSQWNSLGRNYSDASNSAGTNYLDWTYFIMDPNQTSVMTGLEGNAGKTVPLTHAPANYNLGFQLGTAANNTNTDFGLSGSFNYSLNGQDYYQGSFNFDLTEIPRDLTYTSDQIDFNCDNVGTNPITITSTDQFGNSCTQSIDLDIQDVTPPTVVTKNISRTISASGQVTIQPNDVLNYNCNGGGISSLYGPEPFDPNSRIESIVAPGAGEDEILFARPCTSDNCSITFVGLDKTVFTCDDIGQNTVTVTVKDQSGNTTTETAVVTIVDMSVPVAATQNITVELDETGSVSITPQMIDNGSWDACGQITLSINKSTFDCSNVGENTVTLIVSDESNNTKTTTAVVKVVDTIAPTVVTQNLNLNLDEEGQVSINPKDLVVLCEGITIGGGNNTGGSVPGSGLTPYTPQIIVPEATCTTDNCSIASISASITDFDCSNIGENTVTVTVTDASGNATTATAIVTINDITPPVVRAKNITAGLDDNGQLLLTPEMIDDGSSDNCEVILSIDQFSFDCSDIGPHVVTLSGVDPSGNVALATSVVTVTVADDTPPTMLTNDITVELDETGNASITLEQIDNGSYDNCYISLIIDRTTFNCSDVGEQTVTLTGTDGVGNTASATAIVTVEDNIPPVVITQNITVFLDENGTAQILPSQIDNGSSDICDITFSLDKTSFDCSDVGVQTVTLTVVDTGGNSVSKTATVTVVDDILPVVQAKNITVELDEEGNVTITPEQLDNGSYDNCEVILSVDQTTFDCTDIGTHSVTLSGVDPSGNAAAATATVTVTISDDAPPTMLTNDITVYLDANGEATITVEDIDNGSYDNCNITLELDRDTFNCSDIGEQIVTLTGTDAVGNSASKTAKVTVEDNIAPVVITKNITVELDANGNASVTAAQVDNNSYDNCDITLSLNASFDCSDIGENTVTLTGTDPSGNTTTATAIVTVEDNIAPSIVANSNITVELDENGTATITQTDVISSIAPDNCGDVTVNISKTSFDCTDLGQNTITVSLTDVHGNVHNTNVTVTVVDGVAPTWTNPTSGSSSSVESPTAPAMDFNVFIKDYITFKSNETEGAVALGGDLNIAGDYQVSTNSPGTFQVGGVPVTLVVGGKVNYQSGNALQVNQNGYVKIGQTNGEKVWYTDQNNAYSPIRITKDNNYNSSPRLHLQANAQQLGVSASNNPVFEGNLIDFDAAFTQMQANALSMGQMDNNANLTNPNGQTISNTNLPNQVKINLHDGLNVLNVTGSDLNNVSVFTFNNQPSQDKILIVNVNSPGTFYWNVYNTGGIGEQVSPYIIYNFYNTDYLQVQGNGSVIGTLFAPFAHINKTSSNNLAGQVIGQSMYQQSGENHWYKFKGTISSGGSTETITNGSTVSRVMDENCGYTVEGTEFTPLVSDNSCGDLGLTYTLSGATTGTGTSLSGVVFNPGQTVVTWSAGDSQSSTTFSFTVAIEDSVVPTVIAQDLTVELDANGNASITAAQVDNGSYDNCNITLSIDKTSFNCSDIGGQTVTLTGTDTAGNSATATATITVIDNSAPVVIAQDITVELDANGNTTITTTQINNNSSDNCSLTSLIIDKTSFDCSDLGTQTVTLTGTDAAGNTATATATVTVVDNIAPTVIAQNITVALDASGNASITAAQVNNDSYDNCEIALTIDKDSFNCSNIGDNTVTLTGTDPSGNSATATATVTVVDNIAPTVIAQDITVALDANGNTSITAAQVNNGSYDNCEIALTIDKISFNCSNVGDNTVTLTGTDPSGNSATATATVTVVDNIAPVVTINTTVTVELDENGTATLTETQVVTSIAPDNCGDVTITISKTSFDCTDLGPNTITVTATDVHGNESTYTVTVTVVDNSVPVWTAPEAGSTSSTLNPTAPAMDFNVFLKEDITLKNNETEGAVALGGDLIIAGDYQVSTNSKGSFKVGNVPVTLVVGGKVNYQSGNSLQVNQNGYVKIGQANGSKVWYQDQNNAYSPIRITKDNNYNSSPRLHLQANAQQLGVSASNNPIFESGLIDFDAAFDQLENNAIALSQLENNANLTNPNGQPISNTNLPNQVKINLHDGINVLNLTGSDINRVTDFTFNNQPSQGKILVINVDSPGTFYWNVYNSGGIGENVAPYIIYNFYNTTFLQVQGNGSVIGSLLAPFAHINKTSYNNISGQVIGKSMYQQGGENHMFGFAGTIESEGNAGTITDGGSVTRNTDSCTYTVVDNEFTPIISDNSCGNLGLTYTLSGATTGNGTDLSGVALNSGETTITWSAGDSQNATTFSFTVVVEDSTAPTIVTQNITVELDANGNASITAEQVDNGSSDNCNLTLSIDKTSFNCSNIGNNTVTLTGTDASGNSASATATVTVVDNIAPSISTNNVTIEIDETGSATLTQEQVVSSITSNNCGDVTISISKTSFDCTNLGQNTVTVTVTDSYGNASSTNITVTVIDSVAPVWTGPGVGGSSSSAAMNPTAPAMDFNIFIKNNLTLKQTKAEGAIALGGDLTHNGYFQVSTNSVGSFKVQNVPVTLLVGGKVNYSGGYSLQVNQNGYIKIGNANGSKVWYKDQNNAYSPIRITKDNNYYSSPLIMLQANSQQLGVSESNNPVFESGLIDFNAAFAQLEANATTLSQLQNNADLTNANGQTISNTNLPNQVKINLHDGINVLNLTGTDLNKVSTFTFNNQPSQDKILVVNVDSPGSFYWNVYNSAGIGEDLAPYIIYNFYNTTFLQVQGNGSVIGSLLAPYAEINKTSWNKISGQIIAKSMNQQGGDTRMFGFAGTIGSEESAPTETIANGETVSRDAEDCTYTVIGNEFTPSVGDNSCGDLGVIYTLSGATTGTGTDLSNVVLNTGETVITWSAGDSQNSTTFTITVIVGDTSAPEFTFVPNNKTYQVEDGNCSLNAYWTVPEVNKDCGVTLTSNHSPGDEFPIGTTTVTYTATDIFNNTISTSFTVTVQASPMNVVLQAGTYNTQSGIYNVSCSDANDGEVMLAVTGGCGPYTFLWSNGAQSQNLTGVSPGIYQVTVTDNNGTSVQKSVALTSPDPITIDTDVTTEFNLSGYGDQNTIYLGFGEQTAVLQATAAGGSGDYTYDWSPVSEIACSDDNTVTVAPQVTTTYTVVVTDSNGCSASQTFTIEVIDVRCGDGSGEAYNGTNGNSGHYGGYTYGQGSSDDHDYNDGGSENDSNDSDNGAVSNDCQCEGRMENFTVVYTGNSGETVKAYNKKMNYKIETFYNVQYGDTLVVNGFDQGGRLEAKTNLKIGWLSYEVHTSCSINILGAQIGPFKVVAYTDGEGFSCSLPSEEEETDNEGCDVNTIDWAGSISICFNNQTLCVSQNEVQGYLDNGATLGSCSGTSSGIEVAGTPASDQTIILEENPIQFNVNTYPNPASEFANITFNVNRNGPVTVAVFDSRGIQVGKTLFEEEAETSRKYTVVFDGSSVKEGLYIIRLRTAGYIETKKLLIKR